MKYITFLVLSLAFLFAPLSAERSAEKEKDMDTIIHGMFFSYGADKEAQIDTFINVFAAQCLETSDKTMDPKVLAEKVKEAMKSPEFSAPLYSFFEKHFTTEEIEKIREIYENETFKKLQQNFIELSQALMGAFNQTIESVLAEHGQAKEKPNYEPKVVSVSEEDFPREVEQYDGLVVVDLYTDWCQPCKRMKPIFEELSAQYPHIKFVKVNCEEAPNLMKRLKITGFPTFLFYKNGKVVGTRVGALGADDFKTKIKEIFG